MKKYIPIIFILSLFYFFKSCSLQNYTTIDAYTISELVKSEEFTFHIKDVIPPNNNTFNDIKNNIKNSFQNSNSTIPKMPDLIGDYRISVKPNVVELYLPSFNRPSNNSLVYINLGETENRYTSKNFTIDKIQEPDGIWSVKIKPKDINKIEEIDITVFKGGNIYSSIKKNSRTTMSYHGYISKNEEPKTTKSEL
ncbi:DUF4251 domain-containing protein [Chryseobacterium oryctis]|uniref:DUF4251 domain-containing protein n=1 Tax=Chryseobacterium oryctis TaxID=2952618 RepID=A0ABT3HM85_9FLAO|nr:DUF4251 domain-containing protein [Chryseobacterium oryctis]MCW3160887.1 DUF4251 domain-containing protein [Chryseobacterium oryctis]